MTIGASIFLIAVGAGLRYAVSAQTKGIDLHMIGLIVMLAGIGGLIVGVFLELNRRRLVRPVDTVVRPVDDVVVERRI